ncbi:DotU family type VI secretion system protein [Alcaligenes sp. SDU_A2]|uniref:DotU family type VI secretion system protein n=1 Tax=Alcaligenes sp. SDU_A2 TaxID=3136634 RepID=UPI002C85705E|nr:DotU family type VI secretion system protein [Alcaligenes sp.]HRL26093.1 DotU family type VI secretion system protein [Alcaligenes sp.]
MNQTMSWSGEPSRKERADAPRFQPQGSNPLLQAANPLLVMVSDIRRSARHADPAGLRAKLVAEIRQFELRAQAVPVANETILAARYCLCTTLDEAAALTPWGQAGVWSSHTLLVTFHNETWGGEKFFQLLDKLMQNPASHLPLLELMYFCLALGFQGRYRVHEHGAGQLETVRQRLYMTLRQHGPAVPAALSPQWRDNPAQKAGRPLPVPVWVAACLALFVCLLMYLGISLVLNRQSDRVFDDVVALRLPALQTQGTALEPSVAPPAPLALAELLAPEVAEGLLAVRDEADRSIITLHGDGLFDSGADQVSAPLLPVIARIADAVEAASGLVLVDGYTDNVPIRSVRFPSNYHLSQARADSVKQVLQRRLSQPERVRAQGRADAAPVADNGTAQGRAQNRRVEITIVPLGKEAGR